VADAALTPELLVSLLRELCAQREMLLQLAQAARSVARPDAAQELYSACVAAEAA